MLARGDMDGGTGRKLTGRRHVARAGALGACCCSGQLGRFWQPLSRLSFTRGYGNVEPVRVASTL